MAVCRPHDKNRVLYCGAVVRVIFIDVEVGPLMVFQHDLAGFSGKQLHMMLFQVDNVIVQGCGFDQGIHARFQPLPQNLTCGRGDTIKVVGAVLNFGKPEGYTLQRRAVRAGFQQVERGQLGVGKYELRVLVGL